MPAIYADRFRVPEEAIDANGHVNNVVYIQWMQDVAIRHSDTQGCTRTLYEHLGSSWLVRSHFIEYLRPAFAGEELEVQTWVCNLKRTRSLRRFRFLRVADGKELARAETDWVYVAAASGRPRKIDPEVASAFILVSPDEEPGTAKHF